MLPWHKYIANDDSDKMGDWRSRFGRSIGEHEADLLDLEAFETKATDFVFQQGDTDTAFLTTGAVDDHTTTAAYDAAMDVKFFDSDRTADIERLFTLNASYVNHTPALKAILREEMEEQYTDLLLTNQSSVAKTTADLV